MLFIYGGSFTLGNSSHSQYPPDWLLEADVVYVSFNYCVGIFGFISTLDEVAPGNLGLKDDHLIALKNPLAGIQFGPVIEPYHNGAFFYNYSERGLSEGYFNHVPTIIGVNSNEGAATGSIPALIRLYSLKYDIQFKLLAPEDLTKYFLGRRIGYIKYM